VTSKQVANYSRRTLIQQIQIEKELLRRKCVAEFKSFVVEMWDVIEPSQPFVDGWHIDEICKHLEAVAEFQIKKLVINIPPRHMKSLLCSVLFPAWVWLKYPNRKFIYGSYAEAIAIRDSIKTRNLVLSDKYRSLFKIKWSLSEDQNQKKVFQNTEGGERVAVGVGSGLTGQGGDYLFIDDPINAIDAFSESVRDSANLWHDMTFSTRYNNADSHAKVIIMQRLHEDDMTGHVLKNGTYEHLIMPARFDPDADLKSHTTLRFVDPRKIKNQLLWPARFNEAAIIDLERDLKEHSEAQLQQDPKPPKGGLFPRDHWQFFETPPSPIIDLVQFWDCAEKPGITNDYSVCATWARTENGFYLLDLWRDKVDAPTLEVMAQTLYKKWRPTTMVIEDKSHGTSLIQYLARFTTLPIIPMLPTKSKELRAISASSTVKAKKCFLPKEGTFVKDFIKEHEKFPRGKNDDQVDTTSMSIIYFNEMDGSGPNIRSG
jgi:predicted phage terminase large subunit-like protein